MKVCVKALPVDLCGCEKKKCKPFTPNCCVCFYFVKNNLADQFLCMTTIIFKQKFPNLCYEKFLLGYVGIAICITVNVD